jgi:prenyltransferase beta subunit
MNWDSEDDVRFFYCACAIHALVYDYNISKFSFDFEAGLKYLNSISNYEGGFSKDEEGESNGITFSKLAGLTYCAIASLKIMKVSIKNEARLIHWLCSRETNLGVNGRTGKVPDSCYTFWVYATLCNLEKSELFDSELAINFVLQCQTQYV